MTLVTKSESLQLNRTQFPSLGIFVSKKVGNKKKTKTTFITVAAHLRAAPSFMKLLYYIEI